MRFRAWSLILPLLLAAASTLPAQLSGPRPQDPLMSLMVAQPQIEIPTVSKATAAFDPPVVRPGQLAFLRVVVNALEQTIDWPTNLTGPPQLEMRPGAHEQILQMTSGNMEPRTAFNLRVRASSPGSFTVPEFVVEVDGKPVTVPSARLEVVSDASAALPSAPQLMLELTATNLFIGQPVAASIVLPGAPAGLAQGLGLPQLTGQGILVDVGSGRQRFETMRRGTNTVTICTCETSFIPIMTGKLTVLAQGFTVGNRFSSPVVITGPTAIPGAPPLYKLLESEPVELNVRPLPRAGELPGFTGAIGSFAVGPPKLAASVLRVGDPVQLTVTVANRGDGPLTRLVAPPPPKVRDWEVFAAADFVPARSITPRLMFTRPRAGLPAQAGNFEGVATFNYTLIPLTEAAHATPPIPFSCFDPKAGAYVDLTIPTVPVTVNPGAAPGDLASLLQASSARVEAEKELVLSDLAISRGRTAASLVPPQQQAWFPLVQLAPAAVFFGLWNWDRRRRYLETHPGVVLRRRARRALHRQRRILQRAARAEDAPRFAAAAVSAMRVACAPHYPAEPRALVGADVLPLLPDPDRSGRPGDVVRRFFAVTDAARFGTGTPNAADLLSLRPDLEGVLQQLEQKL